MVIDELVRWLTGEYPPLEVNIHPAWSGLVLPAMEKNSWFIEDARFMVIPRIGSIPEERHNEFLRDMATFFGRMRTALVEFGDMEVGSDSFVSFNNNERVYAEVRKERAKLMAKWGASNLDFMTALLPDETVPEDFQYLKTQFNMKRPGKDEDGDGDKPSSDGGKRPFAGFNITKPESK